MTAEDAERVRAWRSESPERFVVVVNTTYRLAPWADVLYAMDRMWWVVHKDEIARVFKGQKVSPARVDQVPDMVEVKRPGFDHFSNSGCGAVALAIQRGADKIYLLGYDAQRVNGVSHWHGDHPKPLTNMGSFERWRKFFDRLSKHAHTKGVSVVNCSRVTSLACFPRSSIDDVLPMRREAA